MLTSFVFDVRRLEIFDVKVVSMLHFSMFPYSILIPSIFSVSIDRYDLINQPDIIKFALTQSLLKSKHYKLRANLKQQDVIKFESKSLLIKWKKKLKKWRIFYSIMSEKEILIGCG